MDNIGQNLSIMPCSAVWLGWHTVLILYLRVRVLPGFAGESQRQWPRKKRILSAESGSSWGKKEVTRAIPPCCVVLFIFSHDAPTEYRVCAEPALRRWQGCTDIPQRQTDHHESRAGTDGHSDF
jgi:hypothetical protein